MTFSREEGSLLGYEYETERPETNYVIGGGGHAGVERLFVEYGDSQAISDYGARVESFLNQSTDDLTELSHAVEAELAGKVAKTSMTATPFDGGPVRYGRDYGLGDKVTCVIDGVAITDLVREVEVTLDAAGEKLKPVIGTPNATGGPDIFTRMKRLMTRVANLERRR